MNTETNPLAMSDEAFSQLTSPPPVVEAEVIPAPDAPEPETTDTEEVVEEEEEEELPDKEDNPEPAPDKPDDEPVVDDAPKKGDKLSAKDKSGVADEPKKDAEGKPSGSAEVVEAPDYEGFYNKIMSPLSANGKKIELKSPEEAVQLMQMGANYTRKMQSIAPHRKILTMLEKNGLLEDTGKLSLLIDINKKDPEAIKKFLKDSGIDPQDIDTREESTYREGNHTVTDEEVTFRTALDELTSIPEGRETLAEINTKWDQASKEILWKQPDVMQLIHQQRENGIYALITTELERQQALGAIPATVPYLQAYKKIGDDLAAAGKFAHIGQPAPEKKPAASHVATRKLVPKKDANGDKANAASTSRNAGRKAETVVNPLALSDDEFMKQLDQFQGRL